MATPNKAKVRIEPIDPTCTSDIHSVAHLIHIAFGGDDSDFIRRIHITPVPPSEARTAALTKQLSYAMRHTGKIVFKAVLDDPSDKTKDGEMAGFAIWQPPGVRLKVFPSTKRENLSDEEREMYEVNDLEGWNTVYGGFQEKRDKFQGDHDHWYVIDS